MSTTVNKTLTYYVIQSYLLKRQIYYASTTDVFLGNLRFSLKQPAEVFMKKAVLKNIDILKRKLQACNFIKKRLQHRYFPLNIANFLRTPILKNIC